MTKAYLIFLIAFLSQMMFTKPVYAADSEGQAIEQQEQEPVQETSQEQEEDRQEQTLIVSTEDGIYNLTLLVNTNLRSEPTTDSPSIIVLPFGIDMTSVRKITNTKGEIWYPISYGGMSGFISSDAVEARAVDISDSDEESLYREPQKTPSKNSPSGPNSDIQEIKPENESQKTDTSVTEGSVSVTTSEPKGSTVDHIFIIFMSAALAGVVIALILSVRLKKEYSRYRKYILKTGKDNAYKD